MTFATATDYTWTGWDVGRILRIKPLAPLKHLFDPTTADKAATHPCVLIEKRADYGIVLTVTSTVYEDLIDRVQNEYALPMHHIKNKGVDFEHLGTESRRDIDFSDDGERSDEEENKQLDECVKKHLDWRPDSTTVAGFLQFSRMYVVRPHEVVKFRELGRNWRMDAESMATIAERLGRGDIAALKRRCEMVMDAAEVGGSLAVVDSHFQDLFARLKLPTPSDHGYAGRRFATFKELSIDMDATRRYGNGPAVGPLSLGGCASSSWRQNPRPLPSANGKFAMLPPAKGKNVSAFVPVQAPWTPRCDSSIFRSSQRPGTSHGPEGTAGKQDWRQPLQSQTPIRAHFAQRRRNPARDFCPNNHYSNKNAFLVQAKNKSTSTFPPHPSLPTSNTYSALPSPTKHDTAENSPYPDAGNPDDLQAMLKGLIGLSLSSAEVKKRMNIPAVVRTGFRCAEHRAQARCDCHWRVQGVRPAPEALARMRAVVSSAVVVR